MFRSIQTNGLQKIYESNSEFASKMRMIARAFVPALSIVQYFENLCDHNNFPDEAQSV